VDRLVPPPAGKSLAEVMQEAVAAPGVAERLAKRFGYGSNPEVRRQLYERLEELYCGDPRGAKIMEVINSVVRDSVGKSDPGRYFAYCVVRRLQEKGFIPGGECVDW
jgi:hypothetical protein